MPIRLVVTDVDGTMVTAEKVLTPATIRAAHGLRDAGIHLALASSRPPRGMAFLSMELGLTVPLAGFNGSTILADDGAVIEQRFVPEQAVRASLAKFAASGVDPWLFADNEWLIRDYGSTLLPRERLAVRFDPVLVEDFTPFLGRCGKVVGASMQFDALAACEAELQANLGDSASARRSQPYYLDVTSPAADKGTAVRAFAAWYGVDLAEVCVLGDQYNDLPMFQVAGTSIAMGNAPAAVAAAATHTTASNDQDGWATAVERHVLGTAA